MRETVIEGVTEVQVLNNINRYRGADLLYNVNYDLKMFFVE